jgi:hypothetical protein
LEPTPHTTPTTTIMKKKPSYDSNKKTTGGTSCKPKGLKKSDTELLDRSPDTENTAQ